MFKKDNDNIKIWLRKFDAEKNSTWGTYITVQEKKDDKDVEVIAINERK